MPGSDKSDGSGSVPVPNWPGSLWTGCILLRPAGPGRSSPEPNRGRAAPVRTGDERERARRRRRLCRLRRRSFAAGEGRTAATARPRCLRRHRSCRHWAGPGRAEQSDALSRTVLRPLPPPPSCVCKLAQVHTLARTRAYVSAYPRVRNPAAPSVLGLCNVLLLQPFPFFDVPLALGLVLQNRPGTDR